MTRKVRKTPLRIALRDDSSLLTFVMDGLGAVQSAHREYFDHAVRAVFADSLELDEAVREGREQENRWDYLLGHTPSGEIVAIEPHSAKQDEISTVIKKQVAARDHLRPHLREGTRIAKWLWVASGKVHFADTEKVRRQLDQKGIAFVGTRVTVKHLPTSRLPQEARAKQSAQVNRRRGKR